MFRLTAIERKTLLVAGTAGGTSATFSAPLAALLLSVELMLFEWKPRSLIPVGLASSAAACLRHYINGGHGFFKLTCFRVTPRDHQNLNRTFDDGRGEGKRRQEAAQICNFTVKRRPSHFKNTRKTITPKSANARETAKGQFFWAMNVKGIVTKSPNGAYPGNTRRSVAWGRRRRKGD